jgi:predicted RNase H-like nuclease (RuvC/YqgF family)
MSNPRKIDKDNPLSSVAGELMGAMSSLNMEPCPIEKPEDDAFYLSEMDEGAKHSMEHLRQAVEGVRETEKYIRDLNRKIYDLQVANAELKVKINELRDEIRWGGNEA